MVCTRAQVRLFVFRLLCELRLEVLWDEIGPRQRAALEYALYGLQPFAKPPPSLIDIKKAWCTGLADRYWNMALYAYLYGLTEALVKQDPFGKVDPIWETFRVAVNYHAVAVEQNIPGTRPCTAYELSWLRALTKDATGFEGMYKLLTFCSSKNLQDFIFRIHDDCTLLIAKMQALRGAASFPDSLPNKKEFPLRNDDDGWSTDTQHADSFVSETSSVP